MIAQTMKSRSSVAAASVKFEGFDLKVALFLGLICFLLFWSFWGEDLEKRIYGPTSLELHGPGTLGAEIIVWQTGGTAPALLVGHVEPSSPAERAGLKPGDQIVGLDGRLVSSLETARHIIGSKGIGATLKVTVIRNGRNKVIDVRMNDSLLDRQILKNMALKKHTLSLTGQILATLVFLKLTVIMFFLIYKSIVNRALIVLLFATVVLFLGIFLRIYSPVDAFFAIKFNTISLLLGMGIISVVLDEAGFFDYAAHKISRFAGESRLKILVLFCLITYSFSLVVNNLSAILVMVPMTLKLSSVLGFDPKPFIIGEVISSNIGGASTMVGDFPNMLISSEAKIGFNEFIIFMMPICLILLGVLLIFLKLKINVFAVADQKKPFQGRIRPPRFTYRERKALRRVAFVLCHVIFLFIISERISLNPSAVALFGGLSLFLFSGIERRTLVSRAGFNDILFFIGLFVVVGGLEASGLLLYISKGITTLSLGKPWLLCLVLMWSAALLTAFLNAGPTTALFFPIVLGFGLMPPQHIIWWALSLGVLAGSSATIFGATAGPVSATLVENYGNTLTFGQFAKIGVPIMLLFLSISSVYITYLCLYF
jgi:Na+/H+ antiporter NhaD/arsenite permease-like protein